MLSKDSTSEDKNTRRNTMWSIIVEFGPNDVETFTRDNIGDAYRLVLAIKKYWPEETTIKVKGN